MCQNAVLQLAHQTLRKIFDMAASKTYELAAHHDMTEQLAIVRIIVLREI